MRGQAIQPDLQHDFRRAVRPGIGTLDRFQPTQVTAHFEQQIGKARPDALIARRKRCLAVITSPLAVQISRRGCWRSARSDRRRVAA